MNLILCYQLCLCLTADILMIMLRVIWSPRLFRRNEKYQNYDSYRRISQRRKLEELSLTVALASPSGKGNSSLFSHVLPTDTVGAYNFPHFSIYITPLWKMHYCRIGYVTDRERDSSAQFYVLLASIHVAGNGLEKNKLSEVYITCLLDQ